MAALVNDGDAQRKNERDERDAQGWETVRRLTAGAVSGGDSAEVRVHLYERSFPEEPDRRARAVNANDMRTALDTGAAFGGVTSIAPSRRMIVTCMWGVSDPLRAGRGAKKGAAKWGSLTPHWLLCSAARAAPTRERRHRAPPAADGKAQTGSKIEIVQRQCDPCTPRTVRVSAGERCSRVLVPPPCSPLKCPDNRQPGKARRADDCQGDECYGRVFDQRRGSTLTRVAASSIESSAPRSMWSRCASRA
jgi:hypothetical protein